MLRTEQQCPYSRHTDYYHLWLDKKNEVKKLETNLLDSKKVIRALHLKLTDILKSIKVFEENQDLSATNQEKEENVSANTSSLLTDSVIGSETEVEGHPSNFQENGTELVKGNCDQINLTEKADLPLEIHAFSVMPDSLPKSTDVQKQEYHNATYTAVPVNVQISVSREEVKNEQCDATGPRTELLDEVISDQEFQTESVETYPEMQPDLIHSGLTFEVEDQQLINEMEQNKKTDFQEQECHNATYTTVPVNVQISVSGEEVKNEQCDVTGPRTELLDEVISDQEFQIKSVETYPEIQPDLIHSGLTFVVEDKQLVIEMEQNRKTDFEAASKVGSKGTPEDCGILSMNVFESYKSEPMEELNNNIEDMSSQVVTPSYVPSFDIKGNTSQDEVLETARKKTKIIRTKGKRVCLQKDCSPEKTKPVTADAPTPELSTSGPEEHQSPSSKEDEVLETARKKTKRIGTKDKKVCLQQDCSPEKTKPVTADDSIPETSTSGPDEHQSPSSKEDEVLEPARKQTPRIGSNGKRVCLQKDCLSEKTQADAADVPTPDLSISSQDEQQSLTSKEDSSELNPLLECSHCHKEFRTVGDLDKQPKQGVLVPMFEFCQHKTIIPNHYMSKELKYFCEVCGKTFTHAHFLAAHILSHTANTHAPGKELTKYKALNVLKSTDFEGKLLRCEVSVERIVLDQYPMIRKSNNSSLKSLKCSICGRCFSTSTGLKACSHISHLAGNSHKCNICHRIFPCASHLKLHFRTHTGEKPYECKLYGNTFISASKLISHQVVHSRLKLHKCPVCGKCFKRLVHMKRHLICHTGNKLLDCAICQRKFFQFSSLNTHLRLHTGEKLYHCDICSKDFSSLASFSYHQPDCVQEVTVSALRNFDLKICK